MSELKTTLTHVDPAKQSVICAPVGLEAVLACSHHGKTILKLSQMCNWVAYPRGEYVRQHAHKRDRVVTFVGSYGRALRDLGIQFRGVRGFCEYVCDGPDWTMREIATAVGREISYACGGKDVFVVSMRITAKHRRVECDVSVYLYESA